MKNSLNFVLLIFSLSVYAQYEGLYFSTYYINTSSPSASSTDLINDDSGGGTFDMGTYTYTVDNDHNIIFTETFDGSQETHTYIGNFDTSGQYSILIPDPSLETYVGIATSMKLSSGKTGSSLNGSYITSYYRFTEPDEIVATLFQLSADIDTCIFDWLYGTQVIPSFGYNYVVDDAGRIAFSDESGDTIMMGSVNTSNNHIAFSTYDAGFEVIGHAVKESGELSLAELEGNYKFIQQRYSDDYDEETVNLLTIKLNSDGTGIYEVDTNSHGDRSDGTLAISYIAYSVWSVVLDDDSDHTIYCGINPDEGLITGYFNFEGNEPGILFGIPALPTYTISGTVDAIDNCDVYIHVTGDDTLVDTATYDDNMFNFEINKGHSVVIIPECECEENSFIPQSIHINNITADTTLENIAIITEDDLTEIKSNEILIYPNPATKNLNVKAPIASSIELLDMNGKLIQSIYSTTEELSEIRFRKSKSGMYLIRVTYGKYMHQQVVVKH